MANDVHVRVNRATRVSTVHAESMRNAEPFAPFAVALGPGPALVPVEMPDDEDGEPDYGFLVLEATKTRAKTMRELCDEIGHSRTVLGPTVQRLLATGSLVAVPGPTGGRGKPAVAYGRAGHSDIAVN